MANLSKLVESFLNRYSRLRDSHGESGKKKKKKRQWCCQIIDSSRWLILYELFHFLESLLYGTVEGI